MIGAGVLAIEVVALLGFCGYYLVRLLGHDVANPTRVIMSVVLLLVVAVLLGLLAKGVAAGRGWARTPTVVWQALLTPVSIGMFQSGRADLGALVLALSLTGIAGALLQPST
jgi:hypothetical protein